MLNKVLFLGSKQLGYSILKKMNSISPNTIFEIVTLDDTNDIRSCFMDFKDYANTHKIQFSVLKGPKGLSDIIERKNPSIVIVAGWYWIIPKSVLVKVKNGFIGIHCSLLPKYRGFSPLVWALINGEKKTGLSLFYFSDGIDKGDIIAQKEILIDDNCNIAKLLAKAEIKSLELIDENYEDILNNNNKRSIQSVDNISYCSIRKPEDGIIDWNNNNINVNNFIRAQSDPYPGAFSFINGEKYNLLESRIVQDIYYGVPGVIAKKTQSSIIICCGRGAIEVTCIRKNDHSKNIIASLKFGSKFNSK